VTKKDAPGRQNAPNDTGMVPRAGKGRRADLKDHGPGKQNPNPGDQGPHGGGEGATGMQPGAGHPRGR
jgi:hypothetical protein